MPVIHNMMQRSLEWYMLRIGLVTASCADKLLTPKKLTPSTQLIPYAAKLAGEIVAGRPDDWDGNNITAHGIESEDQATADYQMETANIAHIVGFITDKEKGFATCGCSPDGLVDDDGMIEIKAQFVQGHVMDIVEHETTGKEPEKYRLQIQMQMLVAERKWCDLVLYHPDLPLKVIRVLPDLEIHEKLAEQIRIVIKKRDENVEILRNLKG